MLVDGVNYVSEEIFSHRKAAEQDIVKYALECISKKLKDEGSSLIREVCCFLRKLLIFVLQLCQNVCGSFIAVCFS